MFRVSQAIQFSQEKKQGDPFPAERARPTEMGDRRSGGSRDLRYFAPGSPTAVTREGARAE
jgi:hypothetical protein